ncbi:hypothetical protein BC628DRAFT_1503725 [Trametes gibbosa]|nr:hypothetical protein BC628DRAFT_1503725 [Trametes gibbosa]
MLDDSRMTNSTFIEGHSTTSGLRYARSLMTLLADLTNVGTGFSTPEGKFTAKWTQAKYTFTLTISTPKGTTSSVGIPLPGCAWSGAAHGPLGGEHGHGTWGQRGFTQNHWPKNLRG